MKLVPIRSSRRYNFWRIITPYLSFPLNHIIEPEQGENIEYEPGFRLSTIVMAWSTIESFTRSALHEKGQVSINLISQKDEWIQKRNCIEKFKRLFKLKIVKDEEDRQWYIDVRKQFLRNIEESAWNDLLKISEEVETSIKSNINQKSWDFLKHLYSLRNGFIHGVALEFGKGNFKNIDDTVTNKYKKALMYFSAGKKENKIIDFDELLKKQDINLILNKKVTDEIINRTVFAIDEIANLFPDTNTSKDWVLMRNKSQEKKS